MECSSSTGLNFGLSIAGMPSFGGPPDVISSHRIERFAKSVLLQPSGFHASGSARSGFAMPGTSATARINVAAERAQRIVDRIFSMPRVIEAPVIGLIAERRGGSELLAQGRRCVLGEMRHHGAIVGTEIRLEPVVD